MLPRGQYSALLKLRVYTYILHRTAYIVNDLSIQDLVSADGIHFELYDTESRLFSVAYKKIG